MDIFKTAQAGNEQSFLMLANYKVSSVLSILKFFNSEWTPCDDIAKWVMQTFPIVEITREFESYPFISSEQVKIAVEVRKASALIAKQTRRGMGNSLYLSKADNDELPDELSNYTKNFVEGLLPPNHILVLYEGSSPTDRGFLYEESRGVLQTEQTPNYGFILKIVS